MRRGDVLASWGYRCGLCEQSLPQNPSLCGRYVFEVDHFVPRSFGGSDTRVNLWPLCTECHAMKTQVEATGRPRGLAWCPLCSTKYNIHLERHSECFKTRFAKARSVFTPNRSNKSLEGVPPPSTWFDTFGFIEPAQAEAPQDAGGGDSQSNAESTACGAGAGVGDVAVAGLPTTKQYLARSGDSSGRRHFSLQ